ncbi:MAG: AMP-binding protein [Pseudomonadota bacterium]|nr:AMP-binding protein [Pseudomonadota bacterium]
MTKAFTPSNLPLVERTVGRILARQADRFADKNFIETTSGDCISYRDMHLRSNQFAQGAAAFGIEYQEPVLVMLPDTIDYVTVWCGLAKRGAIEVPINLAYRKNILKRLCNDSTAKRIIIDCQYVERLEEIADDLEHLDCVILYAEDQKLDSYGTLPPKLTQTYQVAGFEDLFSDISTDFEPAPQFSDLVGIMYTSGTTGASKGVSTTHSHSFCYADGAAEIFYLSEEDRFYTAGLPLFHLAGQWGVCFASMIYGATVVLRKGYRNDNFWPDIAEHSCTVVFLLGAIANFLWQQPKLPEDSETPLKKVGMFPVMTEHKQFRERFGVEISTGYGSTESPCPVIHHFDEPLPNHQCVGFPTGRYDVKILDENDQVCTTGTVGEICTRPRAPWEIMLNYWRQPEYTAKVFRNLWYHTGDAGYQDDEGRLFFVDRLTDSMRRRGENISSMEVEDEVNQHPDVLECAVFPVLAEHSEQEVMVVITPQPDVTIEPEKLIRFLDQRMAYFMIPRYIEFTAAIPKTPTGKMEKYKLRAKGITPSTWDRVAAGIKLSR